MNIILLMLSEIRMYNKHVALLNEIDQQYKCDVELFNSGVIDKDEMNLINSRYKSQRDLNSAPLIRTRMCLSCMMPEDREYITNEYILGNSEIISNKTKEIFIRYFL